MPVGFFFEGFTSTIGVADIDFSAKGIYNNSNESMETYFEDRRSRSCSST